MTDDTMMREAFENNYLWDWPNVGPSVFARDSFGDEYSNRDIQSRWEGWQAAWSAAVRATAEECARICDSEATIEGIAQKCAAEIRNRFGLEAIDAARREEG